VTLTPHDLQIHADPDLWWRAPRTVVGQGVLQVLLSEREAAILGALVMAGGSPVSREVLASLIDPDNPRAVDYVVRRIRAKVEPNPLDPVVVQSVQGIGYRIATVGGSDLVRHRTPHVGVAKVPGNLSRLTHSDPELAGTSGSLGHLWVCRLTVFLEHPYRWASLFHV
jgi:hypothetical protein